MLERADHGDADRAGVEAARIRADHVLVDAAVAALVDGAVAVDEEVVADVVPAVRLDVVDLDPAHDRGRLRGRVVVRARRVVHDREADRRRVRRGPLRRIDSSAPQALRGTIGGEPAEATARSGILSSGLRTNDARRSRTRPLMRYRIPFAGADPGRVADAPAARRAPPRASRRPADPPPPRPRRATAPTRRRSSGR